MMTIIYIVFCFNCFIAGHVWSEAYYEEDWKDKLLYVILSFIFGIFLATYIIVLEPLGQYLNDTFQINFWLKYLFTKRYHNVPIQILENLNENIKQNDSSSIHDRIYRSAIRLINKRNSYTPISPTINSNN